MSAQPFPPSTPSPAAPPSLPPLNLNAAGIDIGATSHFVAVPHSHPPILAPIRRAVKRAKN